MPGTFSDTFPASQESFFWDTSSFVITLYRISGGSSAVASLESSGICLLPHHILSNLKSPLDTSSFVITLCRISGEVLLSHLWSPLASAFFVMTFCRFSEVLSLLPPLSSQCVASLREPLDVQLATQS